MSEDYINAKMRGGRIDVPIQVREAMKVKDDADMVIEYDKNKMVIKTVDFKNFEKKWEEIHQEIDKLNLNMTDDEVAKIVKEDRLNRTEEDMKKLLGHD